MTTTHHGLRIGVLMVLATVLLGYLARSTAVFFDDGLRYIAQAQGLDRGSIGEGLLLAVDHPAYPAAIALAHRAYGGDTPESWEAAAQAASVVIGVLLVIPLYLVAMELFGGRSAWLGVVLTYAVPLTGHVLSDVLSEGTFLLFWTWGLYAALRFLREGRFPWLPLMIAGGGMAYLSRPEGILLPAAMVATLAVVPLLRSTRMNWPRWWAAVGFLVIGPAVIVGPYVAMKGGIGTKPAVQRLLGTAPASPADAVERSRPLDPAQSTAMTYAYAAKAVFEAVKDAVTLPLLPFAALGIFFAIRDAGRERARAWVFLGVIGAAALLALLRLHATGGYCSPRHAMVLAFLLIPASASAIARLLTRLPIPARFLGMEPGAKVAAGPVVWIAALGGFLAWTATATMEPVNFDKGGYREAGLWVAKNVPPGAKVVDVTGLALFFGSHPGYTFADLDRAPEDPGLRWVVVRDNHLKGPWGYCHKLQELVQGLEPKQTFPADPKPGQSTVYIFEKPLETAAAPAPPKG